MTRPLALLGLCMSYNDRLAACRQRRGRRQFWGPHLHDAGLVVGVLRQAAQREGAHLLQLHVRLAQHRDQRRDRPPLHYPRLQQQVGVGVGVGKFTLLLREGGDTESGLL